MVKAKPQGSSWRKKRTADGSKQGIADWRRESSHTRGSLGRKAKFWNEGNCRMVGEKIEYRRDRSWKKTVYCFWKKSAWLLFDGEKDQSLKRAAYGTRVIGKCIHGWRGHTEEKEGPLEDQNCEQNIFVEINIAWWTERSITEEDCRRKKKSTRGRKGPTRRTGPPMEEEDRQRK